MFLTYGAKIRRSSMTCRMKKLGQYRIGVCSTSSDAPCTMRKAEEIRKSSSGGTGRTESLLKKDGFRRAPKPRGFCEGENIREAYGVTVSGCASEAQGSRLFQRALLSKTPSAHRGGFDFFNSRLLRHADLSIKLRSRSVNRNSARGGIPHDPITR